MKKNFFFTFLFILQFTSNRILNKSNIKLKNSYDIPRNLRLNQDQIKESYNLGKVANKEVGKLNFMKVMLKILKHADNRKLNIKNIKLGKGLKKVFKNPFIVDDMKSFLEAKNVGNKIKIMEKKIQKEQRKLTIKRKKENELKIKRKRKLNAVTDAAKKAAGGEGATAEQPANTMGFNFLPGFAGMPFPPFMMQGPHFHPPINMTVNSIPNPNPQADLNPFEIEQSNLKTQLDELSSIKTKLLGLGTKMSSIDQQIGDGLEDKYTKIMQLNV